MHITDYMDPQLFSILEAQTRDDTLKQLVDLIDQSGRLKNKEEYFQAILEREKIVSTGIGMGVAIPHAKLHGYDHFFIAVGILQKPVEWGALDGAPVRLVFMIGGPDDKQTEYLQLLSHLTHAIKDEELRKKLFTLDQSSDIIELFKSI